MTKHREASQCQDDVGHADAYVYAWRLLTMHPSLDVQVALRDAESSAARAGFTLPEDMTFRPIGWAFDGWDREPPF